MGGAFLSTASHRGLEASPFHHRQTDGSLEGAPPTL